ncbi:prephenate/arogenate dehydrogenase family protein [Paradevosia shaoguanensis]|uniref:prephenate dehydrogenase n=1 Tax=Paradevosia shaoguanensis TaxID=1335043 RepID=A0AA41QRE8_9HYPH|nr:prephenate/arogenate dehydrogenase family protein [Paradevosia shaoguanensis]MCF1744837.1 prephenate/arogenate dehydrogenase family protein [Paradevosia shaoguanensis]MCI0129320.1 prephenate/arogenate dehydrogenase family protein [Paradevosia shaoguanensis]QMV00324.1 prephenate/arogenate dehydrogenase family protein [Devosia sp. D6-9]CDP53762.1 Cyclohexadienyl dehydrogenase [Devosia sp. DBB001]
MTFEKLALIGIGLIGSSIARAVRQHGLARTIAISTRSQATLDEAKALGLGDIYERDPARAVEGADLVILCTPVGAYEAVTRAIAAALMPGAIVSDVGSVKEHVVKVMKPLLPANVHFIPGHPIAGTEHSGPSAGFPELFINRWCVLTPEAGTDPEAIDKLVGFWRALGSNVEVMDPAHHDMVLAITSHIPHLIAYNIVGTVADLETSTKSEVIKFSASGFRDFTRIAASDPVMWRDVFLTNRDAVLEMLGRFNEDLSSLQRAVRNGDGPALEALFTRTRAIRRSIINAGQETAAADFGRPHGTDTPAPAPAETVQRDHGGGEDA